MNTKSTINIELTPEQQDQIKQITGKDVPRVKLALDVLESRIAPALTSN